MVSWMGEFNVIPKCLKCFGMSVNPLFHGGPGKCLKAHLSWGIRETPNYTSLSRSQ